MFKFLLNSRMVNELSLFLWLTRIKPIFIGSFSFKLSVTWVLVDIFKITKKNLFIAYFSFFLPLAYFEFHNPSFKFGGLIVSMPNKGFNQYFWIYVVNSLFGSHWKVITSNYTNILILLLMIILLISASNEISTEPKFKINLSN